MGQSKNVYQAKFTINGDEYENKPIFCIFEDSEGKRKFMNLGYGTGEHCINIPSSVLIDDYFKIGLFAGDRLTTNIIKINLVSSLYQDDLEEAEEEADPHAITDIYQKLESKAKKCHTHEVSDIIDFPDIPTKTSELENDGDGENPFLTEHQDISGKANVADLADVAFSGDYDDLVDPPHIPTELSELENDMGYVTDATLEDYLEVSDVSAVALTGSYTDLREKPSIPENTSDLYNDGDGEHPFLTEHQDISGKANISDLGAVAFSNDYDDLSNLPFIATKTSQLINDQEFATIYDVAQSVGNLQLVEIVEQLPTENIKPNRLYLVLAEGGSAGDLYDIYIRVNNQWEKIDTMAIDISGKEDKANKVISLSAQSTDTQYPSAKAVYDELETKADSADIPTHTSDLTNDGSDGEHPYLTAHQDVSGKEDKANKVTSISSASTDVQYASAKCVYDELGNKADSADLATVATTGDYEDLDNTPTIPSAISDLTNDSDFIETSATAGLVKNDGTIDTTQYVSDVSGKEDSSNKVTALSSASTDVQYPSAKAVYDELALKQDVSSAFSGDYDDLTNKPTIPSIAGLESASNKVTSISSSSTDTEYPSAKCVYDAIDGIGGGGEEDVMVIEFAGDTFTSQHTDPFTYTGDITIDWGDGNKETYSSGALSHTYSESDTYKIVIDGNITIIKDSAYLSNGVFANINGIKSIIIPKSVTKIGSYAFYNSGLTSIAIPNSVTTLGSSIFSGCKIANITLPESITDIPTSAFFSCTYLKSVTFLGALLNIGESAFNACTQLKNITIPDSVGYIGSRGFNNCASLKSITIPKLTTDTLPNYILNACYNLVSVNFSESITSIGEQAFQNSKIKTITIPSLVTSIGVKALADCSVLNKIVFKPTTPPTVSNANTFSNLPTTCKIYVPIESITAYKTASNYPDPSVYEYVGVQDKVIDAITDGDMQVPTANAVYDAIDTAIGNIQSFINQ